MKVLDTFKIKNNGTIYAVKYFENWENVVGTEIELDGIKYLIKDVSRNKCSGFFYGTDEEWEKRDVFLIV